MKKIIFGLLLLFLVGCTPTEVTEPIENSYPTYDFDGVWVGTATQEDQYCYYEGSGEINFAGNSRSYLKLELFLIEDRTGDDFCKETRTGTVKIKEGVADGNQINFLSEDVELYGNAYFVTEKLIGAWTQNIENIEVKTRFEMVRAE